MEFRVTVGRGGGGGGGDLLETRETEWLELSFSAASPRRFRAGSAVDSRKSTTPVG